MANLSVSFVSLKAAKAECRVGRDGRILRSQEMQRRTMRNARGVRAYKLLRVVNIDEEEQFKNEVKSKIIRAEVSFERWLHVNDKADSL